jgi:ubiquinone/menaquinone biosynthesis C-methylase UbiE
VIKDLASHHDFSRMRMLHFAPDECFQGYFKTLFREYITADLSMHGVDYHVDVTKLPFQDATYDVIFASHVLEHIREDLKAIAEIRRVLKPGGFAILPVPIVSDETIEYPEPNPFEYGHVRAPGRDYYERYRKYFSRIDERSSHDYPTKYQTYVYEDRRMVPNEKFPWRKPMAGAKHIDVVPTCFV